MVSDGGGKAPRWHGDRRWIPTRSILRVRANGLHGGARFIRAAPSSQKGRDLLVDLEPDVVYGVRPSRTVGLAFLQLREPR